MTRKKKKDTELEEENEHLRKENERLKEENTKLKKRLRLYENPHTPPSKLKLRQISLQKKPRKRGAPVGHKGITRKTPAPTRFIDVVEKECPYCHSNLGEPVKVRSRIIEEIPEPPPAEAVQFNIAEYECPSCKRILVAKHPECPKQGRFGVRMLSLIVFLQIFMRGVTRKVPAFLKYQNGMNLSPASCSNILSRIGKVCQKEYDELKERMRKSSVVYADETSISVMGEKYWIWIFRGGSEVLIAIRKSRGGQVLEEVLGVDWEGVIVCDGWGAYRRLEKATLQRCWSHLIREVKDQEDTVPGRHLYQKLVLLFKEIKAFKKSGSDDGMRQIKHDELLAELNKLTAYYRRYPYLGKLLTYIENGGSNWFTCILYEGVEPTNNFAEQSLREMVILRNIIGAIRSENVSKYENTCSLFATWKLKKEDAFANLKKIISEQYCMS